ncbi:MAG: S9 family peptidase [Acidobacteriota bacterium]
MLLPNPIRRYSVSFVIGLLVVVSLVAMATVTPLAAQDGDEPIRVTDLPHLKTVNGIDVSADGQWVAYVVRSIHEADGEWSYRRHLWLAATDGSTPPRQLTHGERRDGNPVFSPDGTKIAFQRVDDDTPQIWILPLGGGEAYPLTDADEGAYGPVFSADGKTMVYGSALPEHDIEGEPPWKTERARRAWRDTPNFRAMEDGEDNDDSTANEEAEDENAADEVEPKADGTLEQVRAWLAKNAADDNPKVFHELTFQDELGLEDERSYGTLFLTAVEPDAEPVRLTHGYMDVFDPVFTPAGDALVATARTYDRHPDRVFKSDLWRIPLDGSGGELLVSWGDYQLNNARFTSDGSHIVFVTYDTAAMGYSISQLARVPATGGTPSWLAPDLLFDVTSSPVVSDDGFVYARINRHGTSPVVRIPETGGAATDIVAGPVGVRGFDLEGDVLAYALTRVTNPTEVFSAAADGSGEQRLSDLHHTWLQDKHIVEPTGYWVDRPDGTKVQYWVMEPAMRNDGTEYPTVLQIHGGPAAMWGPGELTMWHEFQVMAGWGYGVVYSNPRGSGGYGYDFQRANEQDWGHGPAGDILAALDEAVSQYAWIDRDQLFVTGGSYAGYMTAWLVTQDHRFNAAVAQRGVYELSFFFGEGNAWWLVPWHFGGYPWEDEIQKILDANSPQTFVDQIQTPLLILHADRDLRTGVNQSEMLYKSLKVLEKPVEYVRYPEEGHELSRSGNPLRRMDRILRIVEFFERWAEHPEPPPAISTAE